MDIIWNIIFMTCMNMYLKTREILCFEVWYRKNNVQRSSVEMENDPQVKPVSARFRTRDLSRVRRT